MLMTGLSRCLCIYLSPTLAIVIEENGGLFQL